MKRIGMILIIIIGLFIITPSGAFAQADVAICEGLGAVQSGSDCNDVAGEPTVNSVIRTVLNLLSFAAGVIAVIMLIVAGLKYITSSGDGKGIAEAKSAIIYAIVGIIIVVLAQTIVRFVLTRATE